MLLSDAKELLKDCVRTELRDHAFGDVEVTWEKDGEEIAGGYFSGKVADVFFMTEHGSVTVAFEGEDARELRTCGTEGHIERNDETGPETFTEGSILPGLTLEGVRQELIGSHSPACGCPKCLGKEV